MTRRELLRNYEITDEEATNKDALASIMLDYGILTNNEFNLITDMDGFNERTLLNALHARTGLNSLTQLLDDLARY